MAMPGRRCNGNGMVRSGISTLHLFAGGGGRSVSDVLWEIASLNADIPLAERMKGGSRVFCFPSIESKRSVLGDTYRI